MWKAETELGGKDRGRMRQSEEVQAHLRQLSIICFAVFSGVVIFTVVVWYLLASGDFPPEDLDFPSWMGSMFNAVALVALVKAHFIPRLFGKPGPGAPETAWMAWHKKTIIVGFALREGAAFVALVGAMLTGQLVGAIIMVGLAIISMIPAWPRVEQMQL